MKILRNELVNAPKLRSQKNFPIKDIEFIDITPTILQKEVFNEIIDKFYERLKDENLDYLVLPEARGFLFGSAVAQRLNVGIVPVRKKGKLPPNFVEVSFEYKKEYGKDVFELPKLVDDEYAGKRFYIIDDLYATGNTMKAIAEAIEGLSGVVVGMGAIVNIPSLNDDKNVYSLIDLEETND